MPLTVSLLAQGITPESIITTVAGGSWQFRGDGKPAIDAALGDLRGVAVDSAGNVFALDEGNNLVVKISPGGLLTVVAGNGLSGFSGDGGPATTSSLSVSLEGPSLTVVSDGTAYITTKRDRVRKVTPDGTISTVAGTGINGFSGDGVLATDAHLAAPSGLAVDAGGNIFIAERGTNRVRKIGSDGFITTVAGTGQGGFSGDGGPATSAMLNGPIDVTVDVVGNLYIADYGNLRIRKIDLNGVITTLGGNGARGDGSGDGGPATNAPLLPWSVDVDASGNLYIVDADSQRVRKVTPNGIITTVAGGGTEIPGDGGPATNASFTAPSLTDVVVDPTGSLYISEGFNQRIRKVNPNGIITTFAGNGNFKFSGDGGPATSAPLRTPRGLAIGASDNLYIADAESSRIRTVSSNGIISTVAGNGTKAFSGDGGPARDASLFIPEDVAVDLVNNLYIADFFNTRVRKVTPSGLITTVAGKGLDVSGGGFVSCMPGQEGPAKDVFIGFPSSVVLDPTGNLYIAAAGCGIQKVGLDGILTEFAAVSAQGLAVDGTGNLFFVEPSSRRVRRISPNAVITTVAGNGENGFSGDGGPATSASLFGPEDIAIDGFSNLYIADSRNQRIRRVSPGGTIMTVAGDGLIGLSGDGGPASSARFFNPHALAVDSLGNLYIADQSSERIRKVWVTVPGFVATPSALSFTAAAGSPVVAAQRISVLSEATGLQWSATTTTETGGDWLTVTPATGQAPGTIAASVNVFGLDPGTYRGTIAVNAPLANPPTRAVAVTLTVEQALKPKLVAEPLTLTYETETGTANVPAKTLRVSNGGGGTVEWSAQAETSSGGSWLELSPSSGSVSPGSPITAQVRVVPGELPAGVYTGSIRLSSSTTGQSELVPVTLLVEQPTKTILVSQTGLIFTGVEGGAAVASQAFGIANIGEGEMIWNVEASTLSGGPNWLTVSPREGRSQAGSLRIPEVEVSVNVEGLIAGQYNGVLRVNAFGASNGPQFVTVTLDVLPPGSNPGVTVRPTGMIFAAQAGTFSPSSQNVRLSMVTPGQVEARSGLFTDNGGNWIEILPPNVVVSADDPRRVVVQPKLRLNEDNPATELPPGVYRGQLAYEFSDGSPTQRVDILFLVVPGPAGASTSTLNQERSYRRLVRDDTDGVRTMATGLEPAVEGCMPQRLHAVYRTVADNFRAPVSWPNPIEVLVANDCGGPVTTATVVASFSNGDPPLTLNSLGNGIYVGTWLPETERDQVLMTVRAEAPPLEGVELRSQGQLQANPSAPAVSAGGVVNAASYASGEPVTPGGIISVFGRNLAQGLNAATQLPLEKTLGGTTLSIGGIDAPLFFSSEGQINGQVPFELAPNTRPQVVVKTTRPDGSEVFTLPETITVAAARPAVFTLNQQGTGQGAILNQDYSANSAVNAAERGSVVQIFATGLGATNPVVASGEPAPSNPPALVTAGVEAHIGGQPATVQFAGMAPGFVGLYQVNVVVPASVQPGAEVELTLTQNGVPSNTVTLAIR